MRKHVITATINPSEVTTFERYSAGVRINVTEYTVTGWNLRTDIVKFKYNKMVPYFRRAVPELPESNAQNTLITSDGLIGVFGTDFINIIDLFEPEELLYSNVISEDSKNITDINEYTNPLNKRVFIVNKNINDGYLETKNFLIYTDSTNYYFESDMNYDLPVGIPYGYYKTTAEDWPLYQLTSEFQFYKKQLFVIESDISDLELEYNGEIVSEDANIEGKKMYYFPNLSIVTGSEQFITFKFKSASKDYGFITIY